ncbi:MAG: RNA polymerase factor sigma-54 [Saprospirales bacterium]|nr:RNA polymerase factor sigma-54 [Saprospirales bacterium]MBK8489821.1 RNA polymerase factor sigma-54 [Saprospirales bacterium]
MLKQNLSQKLLQKLSPQQIQLMKLLQIPTAILEQRIKEELELNPALEEGDEFYDLENAEEEDYEQDSDYAGDDEDFSTPNDDVNLDDYWSQYIEDDPSSYKYKDESHQSDEEEKTMPVAIENSFSEYLEQQLGLLNIQDKRQEQLAKQILGSIDDDGYLRRDPEAIVDDLLFTQNISATPEEIQLLLKQIQRFDPPGIGARDLQECLAIQLELKLDNERLPRAHQRAIQRALVIIEDHFEEFSKKHYTRLQRDLNLSEDDLKEAIDEILKLNPKPASGYNDSGSKGAQYIVPDFILLNREGELELTLNSRNAPDLRINDQYRDMLITYKETTQGRRANKNEKEAILFIKQKIDSAKWFIDAIRQRQETMFRTMYAIMQYQQEFFQTGDERKVRPMILKDIADITGYDISTISRVANSKYVQTEFGTKRLKEFFSESMQNSEGEEVSTVEVKKILSDVIGKESKRKPLSDEKLKEILLKKGYNIARRTVAKYREQLNIPVARLRKEL